MPFALITGASKGIGKAIAETLALRGYDLLLVARSADLLEQVSKEIQTTSNRHCRWLAADLAENRSAEKVFEWCTQNQFEVSILVNNAGYGLSGPFEKYSPEEHADMLQVNIITLTKLTRLFLPQLLKQPKGIYPEYCQFCRIPGCPFSLCLLSFQILCTEFQPGPLPGT